MANSWEVKQRKTEHKTYRKIIYGEYYGAIRVCLTVMILQTVETDVQYQKCVTIENKKYLTKSNIQKEDSQITQEISVLPTGKN